MTKRAISFPIRISHVVRDEIATDKGKITLTGTAIFGKKGSDEVTQKTINMNFSSMSEEDMTNFMLAFDTMKLTENTPLFCRIEVPEGSLLDDWTDAFGKSPDPSTDDKQATIDEQEDPDEGE